MKCRLVEKTEKQLGVSAFQKKKSIRRIQKCAWVKRFYPVIKRCQIIHTQIHWKVFWESVILNINILPSLFQKRYGNWLQVWKQAISRSSVLQNTFSGSACITVPSSLSLSLPSSSSSSLSLFWFWYIINNKKIEKSDYVRLQVTIRMTASDYECLRVRIRVTKRE